MATYVNLPRRWLASPRPTKAKSRTITSLMAVLCAPSGTTARPPAGQRRARAIEDHTYRWPILQEGQRLAHDADWRHAGAHDQDDGIGNAGHKGAIAMVEKRW